MRILPNIALSFCLATSLAARQVPLTILHTSCVRGHVLPPEKGEGGGLLRISSLVSGIRSESPNVLLVDSGDFFLGSPEAAASRGMLASAAFASISYDFLVPGIRDLASGPNALTHWMKDTPTTLLAANLSWPGAKVAEPWVLREVDGLYVAIVGLTLSDGALHLRPEMAPGARFASAEETLRRLLPSIREKKPDVRILIVHSGGAAKGGEGNEAKRLLQEFPDFDLFIGGRSGAAVAEYRPPNGPLYVEAGENAESLGRVDLIFDTVKKQLVRSAGTLISARSSSQSDGDLRQSLQAGFDRAARILETPLLPRPAPAEGEIRLLLAGSPPRLPLARCSDVLRLFPSDQALGEFECSSFDLQNALAAAPSEAAARLWIQGIALERDKEARLVSPDGLPLNPRKKWRITADAFLLSSGGGPFTALRQLAERSGLTFPGRTLYEWWKIPQDKSPRSRP